MLGWSVKYSYQTIIGDSNFLKPNKFYVHPLSVFLLKGKYTMNFDSQTRLESMQGLSYARESLSDVMLSSVQAVGGFAARLAGVMPGIISGFASNKETVALPDIKPLSRDQSKFLKVIKDVPYSDLRELKAYQPEGVCVTYLEYLEVLLAHTQAIKSIQSDVIQPYMLFLAQLISDKSALVSTKNNRVVYQKLESVREKMYQDFAKLYKKDSYAAEVHVKDVAERNADWPEIFKKINVCNANMQSINKDSIKHQIQQCTDYLALLQTYLQENKMEATSAESAQHLAEGAYCVASELEAMAATYYRVLALNGSVENTVEHVIKAVG